MMLMMVRFQVVAATLKRAYTLESMQDFCTWLTSEMPTARGRTLHVECVEGTHNFVHWMAELDISGIAAMHAQPNAAHVFRLVSRNTVGALGFSKEAIVVPTQWGRVGRGAPS